MTIQDDLKERNKNIGSVLGNNIIFYMIDTHENFYRELKRYIKEAE